MGGHYVGKLRMLKINKSQLVQFVNSFSNATGLSEPPAITAKAAFNTGLKGVHGINIHSERGGGHGGRNDRSDGRGRGRGGGRPNRYDDDGGKSFRGRGKYNDRGTAR